MHLANCQSCYVCVVAERLRALDASSGVYADQQSVGLSRDDGTCALYQNTITI